MQSVFASFHQRCSLFTCWNSHRFSTISGFRIRRATGSSMSSTTGATALSVDGSCPCSIFLAHDAQHDGRQETVEVKHDEGYVSESCLNFGNTKCLERDQHCYHVTGYQADRYDYGQRHQHPVSPSTVQQCSKVTFTRRLGNVSVWLHE